MSYIDVIRSNVRKARLRFFFKRKSSGYQPIHFLHIGRTAGAVTKRILQANFNYKNELNGHSCKIVIDNKILWLHSHKITLSHIPHGHKVVFSIRDPIERFISGFNRKLIVGAPSARDNWTAEEKMTFKLYPTIELFLESLFSKDTNIRNHSMRLLRGIKHLGPFGSYWDFFKSPEYFISRRNDIMLVMNQKMFNNDFNKFKSLLKLPPEVVLPDRRNATLSNANKIKTDVAGISPELISLLKQFLNREYEFIDLCYSLNLLN